MNRPWVINGQVIGMEPWRTEFIPAEDAIPSALLWVRLPNLPMEFWKVDFLRAITEPAGKFICADAPTLARSRGGFARVCLRVDLRRPLRPGTRIQGINLPFWQQFAFENLEGICLSCGSIHLGGSCSIPAGSGVEEGAPPPVFGPWMAAVRHRRVASGLQREERRTPIPKVPPGVSGSGSAPQQMASDRRSGAGEVGGWSSSLKVARRRVPASTRVVVVPDNGSASPVVDVEKGCPVNVPVKEASSSVRSPAPGMQADEWQVQPKLARRRRGKGLLVESMQKGGSEVSPVPKSKIDAGAESGNSLSERAGCKGGVPVSADVQESEHFPSHLIKENPFAALGVDSDIVSHFRSRDACPGPLKRARPAEYQAPRQISTIDKKKGKSEASSSKAKQVKVREEQYLNFDTGSTEQVQPKGLVGEASQPSMETDSSSDPLISVVVDQGPESRPSENSPRAIMIQDVMTCSHQSPDSEMIEDQGGYQPPLPIK